MNLVLFSGILVLLSVVYKSEAQIKQDSIFKKCYKAKTCVHNNHEKCGVNGNNERRRFLDSCDIEEFNCLYDKDYKKVSMDTCRDLPSLYGREGKEKGDDGDQPLRNIPNKLENEKNPNIINLGHNSIEFTDSSMPAEPQNLNQTIRDKETEMIGPNGTKILREDSMSSMVFDESIHGKKTKKPTKVSKIPIKMVKLVKYKTTMEDKTLRQEK